MSEAGKKMESSLDRFLEATKNHVPPEADNIMNETTGLRKPARYRVRIRGTDAQHEVVARFTGYEIPEEGSGEVLILEFVSEHSYKDPSDAERA